VTRIIAGSARGRRLRTPTGDGTRPTADRVREALFSALESQIGGWEGVRFLDLYAGSGAVGLEAASRGADRVVLVEQAPAVAALIRANAATLGSAGVAVVAEPAARFAKRGARPGEVFDVVFADPPYDVATVDVADVLAALLDTGRLAADAVVVVERARRGDAWRWPEGLTGVRDKRYGDTMLWYGRATAGPRASVPGSGGAV
jgi:16S rRNA (guanine966-N2)-methyltransferase